MSADTYAAIRRGLDHPASRRVVPDREWYLPPAGRASTRADARRVQALVARGRLAPHATLVMWLTSVEVALEQHGPALPDEPLVAAAGAWIDAVGALLRGATRFPAMAREWRRMWHLAESRGYRGMTGGPLDVLITAVRVDDLLFTVEGSRHTTVTVDRTIRRLALASPTQFVLDGLDVDPAVDYWHRDPQHAPICRPFVYAAPTPGALDLLLTDARAGNPGAVRALRLLGDKRARGALLDLLTRPVLKPGTLAETIDTLRTVCDLRDHPQIRAALRSTDGEVARAALRSLGHAGVSSLLGDLLADDRARRMAGVHNWGRATAGSPAAARRLARELAMVDAERCVTLSHALQEMGPAAAAGLPAVEARLATETDPRARRSLAVTAEHLRQL